MRLGSILLVASLLGAGCIRTPNEGDVEVAPTPPFEPAPAIDRASAPAESTTDVPGNETPALPLTPWNLSAELFVGYVVAAGAFGETVGTTDVEHCADATFVVPEGALNLTLRLDGEIVDPSRASAGSQFVWVTPPEGDAFQLDPILFESNPSEEPPRERIIDSPVSGDWSMHVDALGPVVGQSWPFSVTIVGASADPPPASDAIITCNGN